VSEIHHHFQPFYYYLPVLLGLLFPWTGWLLALLIRLPSALRRWRSWETGRLFAACWFAFPLLFFSLSGSKLPSYILVSLPPLALLMAHGLTCRPRDGRAAFSESWELWLNVVVSGLMAFAFPATMTSIYGEDWRKALPVALAVLIPAAAGAWASGRRRRLAAMSATAAQGVALILSLALFAFPVLAEHHSTRGIATQVLRLRQDREPVCTYRFFHHTLFYYTGYRIEAQLTDRDSLTRFAYAHPDFMIVTEDRYVPEVERLPGYSVIVVGSQGKLRLLRVAHR
jgi:4-amino-4-deoxy-L-arabinose transferase-like glycosyltransferase